MSSSSGIEHLSKEELEQGFEFSQQKKGLRQMDGDKLVKGDIKSQDEKFQVTSSKEAEDSKANLGHKSSQVTSSPRRGLGHCITAPIGTERNPLIADDEIMLSRSMTEKRGHPRHDLILDRLSEHEREYGHHVRLATHTNFKAFVKSAGVDFYPLGGDPRVLAGYMARNKGLIPSGPGEISIQLKELKAIIDSLLPACTAPDLETGVPFKAQAIIANPPAYGHVHVAEALGVPIHIFFTMPWTPTSEFPHPLARVPQSAGYWLSYIIVDLLIWWGMRGIINEFRRRTLKLAPIAYFSMYRGSISHLPTGYMWSPHVVSKPSDWGPLVDVVGYCFLSLASKYQPREDFIQWIQKGPPPLYFGFGSMPLDDPKKTTDIILEALKDTEQRGIIDRGWGNLGNLAEVSDNVFLLEECPHDWLFPRCSAVVHHGGAGTTATGLKAGCPTTIVPFFGDQFFWGDRIYQKELGPAPIPISQLNVENLSNAIKFMLQPAVKSRAMEIAKLIENEDGVAAAVDAFHRHLPDELPLPTPSPVEENQISPLQWFFIQLAKWCCAPCGGV
ncbi:UDP-glucuronosyl/UDP-glucosyltransferase [Sesbania bispinosa]|nr:UDP-glucuronosyl/UDP-glucosyltransferase [Sesbania bispinosa]